MLRKPCVSFLKKEDAQYNSSLKAFVKTFPTTVNGYTFSEILGWGSFAVVVKAHHTGYNCDFAAKIIPEKDQVDHTSEIRILQSLYHPNVIKIYDSFTVQKNLFVIILQFCKNGTLKKEIKPNVGFNLVLLVGYMKQILDALNYLHKNRIVHRDIKTANIFIDNYDRPLLGDFGLSFSFEDDGTKCSDYSGALLYRPPEILLKQPHDPFKSDIWSLGVVFFIMAVGSEPWSLYNTEVMRNAIINAQFTIPESVNKEVANVIKAMLVVNPEERASTAELLEFPIFSLVPQKRKSVRKYKSNSQLTKYTKISSISKCSSIDMSKNKPVFRNTMMLKNANPEEPK